MIKVYQHDLSIDLAKQATDQAFAYYSKLYPTAQVSVDWQTRTKALVGFTVLGARIEGVLDILPAQIQITLDVPARLKLFEGMAMGVVGTEIQKCLGQAKTGMAATSP